MKACMKRWERDGKPVLVVHALLKSCEHFKPFLKPTVQELYAENRSLITQRTLASVFTLSICLKDKKCSRSSTSWTQFLARNSQATLSPPSSCFQFTSTSLLFLWSVCRAIAGNKTQKNSNCDDLRVMYPPPHFEEVLGVTCAAGQCSAKVDDLSLSPGGAGGSKGDAEFAESTHCTARSTQLFCSQCKYGQPHPSLALLPQHTSRGEG